MFFWRLLGSKLTTPGTQLGWGEWHVHSGRLPASFAFCRCWRRMWISSQRRAETRGLAKVLGTKTSKITIIGQQLEEVNKDRPWCQGSGSDPGGNQETDVSPSLCSACNWLDDLSQASDCLSLGLSFPLCKMGCYVPWVLFFFFLLFRAAPKVYESS